MFIIFNSNFRFPAFYYMLGASHGLLFYGDVSVMLCFQRISFQIIRKNHFISDYA